ncbi:acyclic terpene utilization AtuA family protein [Streptomyces yokosukanensis]|uniref:acyclic terpene utilization AtuA family protein n=1 Tax=Streptomyces yokosukanensis TaxID=67386 RepID=UPI003421FACD
MVAAHAYLGADAVRAALDTGADVVITGRVADPSLFVGCVAHHRGWDLRDADLAARGTLVGHLLECAGQVTAAQLGYEIGDPSDCVTPDVVTPDVRADFTGVVIEDLGGDRVRASGARGRTAPDDLKVSGGFQAAYRCEAEFDYCGSGARGRAALVAAVVRERTRGVFRRPGEDLLGVDPMVRPDGTLLPGSGRCRWPWSRTRMTRTRLPGSARRSLRRTPTVPPEEAASG